MNILSIRGTADSILFYDGGATGYFAWPGLFPANCPAYPGALRTVQIWADYNGARDPVTDSAASMDLVPYVPGFDTVVLRYTSTPPGGAVELWSIIGGQHSIDYSPGFSSRVIDWLLAHPKP